MMFTVYVFMTIAVFLSVYSEAKEVLIDAGTLLDNNLSEILTDKQIGNKAHLNIAHSDFCYPNPCKNKGLCAKYDDVAYCLCAESFTGEFCEIQLCGNHAGCGEGGTCTDGYHCECKPGYEGDNCNIIIGCKNLSDSCTAADAECVYDETTPNQAKCKCTRENYVFVEDLGICKIIKDVPKNLRVTHVTNTSLSLQWEESEPKSESSHVYEVLWKSTDGAESVRATENLYFNIAGLMPFTFYTVMVRIRRPAGSGSWSEEVHVRTDVGIPFPPTGLTITHSTTNSISLAWDAPLPNVGPIVYYDVKWTSQSGTEMAGGFSHESYNISQLKPNTKYKIAVRAHTSAGDGQWAKELIGTTRFGGVPGQVSQIDFVKVTPTRISFRFMGPSDDGGFPVTHYTMRYNGTEMLNFTYKEFMAGKDMLYVVDRLKKSTTYEFSVAARNQIGEGPWKTVEYTMPDATVPERPVIQNLGDDISVYSDRIKVEWDAPDDNGSPIEAYDIRYYQVEEGSDDWVQIGESKAQWFPSHLRSAELTGLEPETVYQFQIRAWNKVGSSLPFTVTTVTLKGEGCTRNYCLNEGFCEEYRNGSRRCICKSEFRGERCQYGNDLIKVSREMILILIASASLAVIASIAVCVLFCFIRSRKAEKAKDLQELKLSIDAEGLQET